MLLGYLIGRSKSDYDVFLDFSQGKIGHVLACHVTCLRSTESEGFDIEVTIVKLGYHCLCFSSSKYLHVIRKSENLIFKEIFVNIFAVF